MRAGDDGDQRFAVHDAFAPYARYPAATHALYNAHLLRELIAVSTTTPLTRSRLGHSARLVLGAARH